MKEAASSIGRQRAGSSLLALSGAYLLVWAIALPEWWKPNQSVLDVEVPTVALGLPWALMLLAGAFFRYQDQPTANI